MFTGIITDLGQVVAVAEGGITRLTVATGFETTEIPLGTSIACSGVCLTVVAVGEGRFSVDVSQETLDRTTLGSWLPGTPINLERALRFGDELGGHLVSGHVDGVATVVARWPEGDSLRFEIEVPEGLARFMAPKGSVALDGVSLTINEVEGRRFGVNVIPHTQACTTFGTLGIGQRLNLEVDLLARYVARLMERT
ncbi:Riboflavin synthase [uncultured Gammaproteobacteria bacterium]